MCSGSRQALGIWTTSTGPVAVGGQLLPEALWDGECTCPAAGAERQTRARVRAQSEARNAQVAKVLSDVDPGRGRRPEQFQREILAAFEAHGVEPLTDYSRSSRFTAASAARHGRRLKLVKEAALGLVAAKRWLNEHRVN